MSDVQRPICGPDGGADFYAAYVQRLPHEGEISLRVFLKACKQRGLEPRKHFSGKFLLRLDLATHEAAALNRPGFRGGPLG